jgi:hypothetical protein
MLSSRCIELTHLQRARIHGYSRPLPTLCWDDLRKKTGISFQQVVEWGITLKDLRFIQPDVSEWVKHKHVGAADVTAMLLWPLHPVSDLGGGIFELAMSAYALPTLQTLDITYQDLRDLRMEFGHMPAFNLTLQEWSAMGFPSSQAHLVPPRLCMDIFGVESRFLYDALLLYERKGSTV